jgi:hypothetical protein
MRLATVGRTWHFRSRRQKQVDRDRTAQLPDSPLTDPDLQFSTHRALREYSFPQQD